MIHLFVQLSKYLMMIMFIFYTFECFNVFRFPDDREHQQDIYLLQKHLILLLHLDGYLVLLLTSDESRTEIMGLYLIELALFLIIYLIYHRFYKHSSELILNNMIALLAVGMIILTRINIEKAMRQLVFIAAGMVAAMLIPLFLERGNLFRKLGALYAVVGIVALGVVAAGGSVSYGAKLSVSIAGISIQPSEFVKIIYVFFIASMMTKEITMRRFMVTGAISAVFVLELVASNDLGGALLFFFTWLMMVYAATRKWYVFAGGLGGMVVASLLGYLVFGHVRTRVAAWKDPLAVYDGAGYQVCQSLFGIGTGGWFGMGLNQGKPSAIPVVEKDFVFAAISEEMGGVFAFCLIMVCVSMFLMIFNVSMQMQDIFYKQVALGLGVVYALQVFLTIGGVIKFIPSTGVTLPLVSYGGSSLLSTMLLFGIIQGLYIRRYREPREKKMRRYAKEPKRISDIGEEDERQKYTGKTDERQKYTGKQSERRTYTGEEDERRTSPGERRTGRRYSGGED